MVVPLVADGAVKGAMAVWRTGGQPFDDRDLQFLVGLSRQAMVALRNARLFNGTQEALERQTATADILKVISSSHTDLQPVFDAIVRNAAALCGSLFANVLLFDGEWLHFAASSDTDPEFLKLMRNKFPMRPDATQVAGRVILGKSVVTLEDVLDDPDYDQPLATAGRWRRMLGVPMLREGKMLGVIGVGWQQPGPISQVHEELLKTFADQAVIAIENVRLFNETKEALRAADVDGGNPARDQRVDRRRRSRYSTPSCKSCHDLFGGKAVALVMPKGDMMEAASPLPAMARTRAR